MNKTMRVFTAMAMSLVLTFSMVPAAFASEGGRTYSLQAVDLVEGEVADVQPIALKSSMVAAIKARTYTGAAIKPGVKVTYQGKKLKKGTDYQVKYSNNKKVGKAKVTITGKGTYTGTVTKRFTIKKRKLTSSMVRLSSTYATFNGAKHRPGVTVRTSAATLKKGRDYTVKYKGGFKKLGKYKVEIRPKGNLKGKKVVKTFSITPESTSVTSWFSGKYGMKLIWAKRYSVDGYQIQCSTSSSFPKGSTRTLRFPQKTNFTTVYKSTYYLSHYIRIRTYKKSGGKTYYSRWSSYDRLPTNTYSRPVRSFTAAKVIARYYALQNHGWYPSGWYIFHCGRNNQYQVSLKSGNYRMYYYIVKESGSVYEVVNGSWRYVGYAG